MKFQFEQFAAYNRWANARLYEAALALDEADYRRNVGAFFKSMHGTLNHLLLADRIGAVRNVVGICGETSSNLKLYDQAARSIG